ncbi:MAG: mitomycin resistance protein [Phycisphaerales bacterium]|nr:mitomycin resistance protein [Phycisphaerales bacterium]
MVRRLADLANVGPATLRDFEVLGIAEVSDLKRREAIELWRELCRRTNQRHDPCCIDVFMSVIAQANGADGCPWWKFTPERKRKMALEQSGNSRKRRTDGGGVAKPASKTHQRSDANS